MNSIRLHLLLFLGVAGLASATRADRASADRLARLAPGAVLDMRIDPVWAPDDSALYIGKTSQILRVDTASGKGTAMIDQQAIKMAVGGTARIERFSISETGDFICLVSSGNRFETLRIADQKPEAIPRKENPFILEPRSIQPGASSRSGGAETAVFFINNGTEPLELFWIDLEGAAKSYGMIGAGETRRQNTYAGHAWKAGDALFVAEAQPALAYLDAVPAMSRQPVTRRSRNQGQEAQWSAFFREGNLLIRHRATQETVQLTTDASDNSRYVGPAMESPDGRFLLVQREVPGDGRTLTLVNAAPGDRLLPQTVTIPYDKPGDNITRRTPCLFDLQTMKPVILDDSLFPNPWEIGDYHWAPDGSRLFFVYNERGHQVVRLLSVDPSTGAVSVLAEEKSATFIDYTNKIQVHHLDATDEAIWMSERSGWNHLYLVDRKTGGIKPITSGDWVVRGIEHFDEATREIVFRAGGIVPGQDPYHIHYARVSFDGSNPVALTEGNGTHSLSFSPSGGFYVDTWSRVDQPPVHELRRTSDGTFVARLGQADATGLLRLNPHLPEPFHAKGRDGITEIHGVIYRPSDFDPGIKYPVVESIYAGPQDAFVPKSFSPWRGEQRLAELGFIVVQIDGMGTNWRSKAFHDVCWKNLKDAGLPDRIAWIKAAAEKYPCMDISRVGIYGSSAGGQNAMRAVIDHADFYKAAAADCGCHDNRMDKIWWNEQWMGWPVDESYAESSNVVDAHRLAGKLLLTVGAMDTNVDPASTMQVVEELVKASKDFELMVFPTEGHGAGMGTFGTRLREDFFIRHLQ